ncbi:MAG: RIP metalloprotease RseP [Gammaproteobacteria bacterium]|nr:RIP metalloprotease RseP [Gammaproteobacteria bacterium]
MSNIFQYILWFVVAIAILVTVHEFGHYWVAKKLGVKVLRFSIGFGRPLLSWRRGPDNTEYVIAALPLGGYVKMLDEGEGEVDEAEKHRAFNNQSLATRFAVVVAGPMANFLFAIVAYALIFMVGVPAVKPVIGDIIEDSIASRAGLSADTRIVSVAGKATSSWQQVNAGLLDHLFDSTPLTVVVEDSNQVPSSHELALSGFAAELKRGDMLTQLGITPFRPSVPATIDEVLAGGAAERAGLQQGDTVIAANGEPVIGWLSWVDIVSRHADKEIVVDVLRDESTLSLSLTPQAKERNGAIVGFIGASAFVPEGLMQEHRITIQYSPLEAIWQGFEKTWSISALTIKFLFNMIIGNASIDNLSSPISIAQYAGQSANAGWLPFVSFLAVISISLGVLNLLPVPMLDGGHLLYYTLELVTGKPPSEQVQVVGQQAGIILIIMLMSVALYNDLAHIFG